MVSPKPTIWALSYVMDCIGPLKPELIILPEEASCLQALLRVGRLLPICHGG